MSEEVKEDPRTVVAGDRTEMATFRTSLALERTTLAWVRTTLSMTGFGLSMIGFFRTLRMSTETPQAIRLHEGAIRFGVSLVVIGVVATVLVAVSHLSTVRKLRQGVMPTPGAWPLSIMLSVLLALLALWGLWEVFAR